MGITVAEVRDERRCMRHFEWHFLDPDRLMPVLAWPDIGLHRPVARGTKLGLVKEKLYRLRGTQSRCDEAKKVSNTVFEVVTIDCVFENITTVTMPRLSD